MLKTSEYRVSSLWFEFRVKNFEYRVKPSIFELKSLSFESKCSKSLIILLKNYKYLVEKINTT